MFTLRIYENNCDNNKYCTVHLFVNDNESGITEEEKRPATSCFMIGLPCEMTSLEFETFLEPYISEISNLEIILVNGTDDIELNSRCAIIDFHNSDGDSCNRFIQIYNNLHFPSYRIIPPCLVIPINYIFRSNSSSSSSSSIKLDNEIIKKERQLPLCSVCMRRIKASSSHVAGANDVPVSMKFMGNGLRCSTCRVYAGENISVDVYQLCESQIGDENTKNSNTNTTNDKVDTSSVLKLRSCMTCGLRENIWVIFSLYTHILPYIFITLYRHIFIIYLYIIHRIFSL